MSDPHHPSRALRCDLFCRVIDNLGDAAVTWRLAAQLAREYAWQVRLIIDDLATLARLVPEVQVARAHQTVHGIAIIRWTEHVDLGDPADVVIEAFACEIPTGYAAIMAALARRPVWINLEYLSAERWVDDCHGLGSIHPQLGLTKYFFFPGFSERSGGVVIERDLEARRMQFFAEPHQRIDRLRSLGADPDAPFTALVFSYPTDSFAKLCSAWAESPQRVQCLIPQAAQPIENTRSTSLALRAIDFVPQAAFDELLWCCDFAIVRGEDSFVRAQLAGTVFAWHIYPQADDAHLIKLEAFMGRYVAGLAPDVANAWRQFNLAWNTDGEVGVAWRELVPHMQALKTHAQRWRSAVAARGDLAGHLQRFVADRLE